MHEIPLLTLLPFAVMLLSIAVMPVKFEKFWDDNTNKLYVALALSLPILIWLLANGMTHELEHTMLYDYVPFIVLLGALFVITGGILIEGNVRALPSVNTAILAMGGIFASLMGTTGAAMLLIRPLIRANTSRKHKVHTILFFIAIAANVGGLLTPIGDPPLFMMYLRGAPFEWFLTLTPEWAITMGILLTIYFFTDSYYIKKETPEAIAIDIRIYKKFRVRGWLNFVWLLGVVLSVALINENVIKGVQNHEFLPWLRNLMIIIFALLSLLFTKKTTRRRNYYSWHPIIEVAYLFLGIFITMIPCLLYLEGHAATIGIDSTVLFYYATGGLSSFLDNTPTAMTFHSLAKGLVESGQLSSAGTLVAGIPELYMKAIATSAVFFGSMTYIGNGPNFMIKSIAQNYHIKMPEFFAYILKFSLIILLPVFIIVEILFMR
jgi:Na+/H+ antiporter NhaD/arsenite permease-like protein